MLKLTEVNTFYGHFHALKNISLEVGDGEIISLLGGNACGKSTTMKSILGLVKPKSGKIEYNGQDITGKAPSTVVRAGISPVLERRRLFPDLTVEENLQMGAYLRSDKPAIKTDIERMAELFPIVAERPRQLAGSLSGGEQQMVAMARALMASPRLLIMDEPSMGLSPKFVEMVFEVIQDVNRKEGVAMLLVEQNANMALSIASRGYVLQTGEIVLQGSADSLKHNKQMQKAYLGVA